MMLRRAHGFFSWKRGALIMGMTVAAPLEWVEAVSGLRLPPKVNDRLQHLMDHNTDKFFGGD